MKCSANSGFKKKDIIPRGYTVNRNFTYSGAETNSKSRSVVPGNAALAVLLGAAYVFSLAQAADSDNSGKDGGQPGGQVYKNIADNNSDPYILQAMENATGKNQSISQTPVRNLTKQEKYEQSMKEYTGKIIESGKDGKLNASEINELRRVMKEFMTSAQEYSDSLVYIPEKVETPRGTAYLQEIRAIAYHYDGLVEGPTPKNPGVTYDARMALRKEETQALRNGIEELGEDFRKPYVGLYSKTHYQALFEGEDLEIQDLLRIYRASEDIEKTNGIDVISENNAQESNIDYKKNQLTSAVSGIKGMLDEDLFVTSYLKRYNWNVFGHNIRYLSYGIPAQDWLSYNNDNYPLDFDRKYMGAGEWKNHVNAELSRLNQGQEVSLPWGENDKIYPDNNYLPGPVGFWLGIFAPFAVNSLIRRYVGREKDDGDSFGPAANSLLGTLFFDSLNPLIYPARLILSPMIWEKLWAGDNSRKRKAGNNKKRVDEYNKLRGY